MKASVHFETWQLALPRRVATLARMHPLHRFEASKAARHIDLGKHDLRTLSLMVFDAVIERMGERAWSFLDQHKHYRHNLFSCIWVLWMTTRMPDVFSAFHLAAILLRGWAG